MSSFKSTLKKIKGDASFRSFYRKKNNKKNSIIVYASNEKEKNLLIYDAINSLLIENKILAPKLYKENYKKNFIEIEDFGDDTVFKLLRKSGSNKINLYKKSIDLLIEIQKVKQSIIKNFKGKNYKVPIYENDKLFKEAKLFSDWYAKKYISKKKLPIGDILDDLLGSDSVGFLTAIIKRRVFRKFPPFFNTRYNIIHDFDLMIRISIEWKFSCVQSPLASYRYHGENETIVKSFQYTRELEEWIDKNKSNSKISNQRNFYRRQVVLMYLIYYYNRIRLRYV